MSDGDEKKTTMVIKKKKDKLNYYVTHTNKVCISNYK